jgi:hypothetical protein
MWNKILHQSAEFYYMWSTNVFLFLNKNRILHLWRLCQGTEIKKNRNLPPLTIKDVYIPDVMCNVSTAKLSALLLCTQTINEIAMKGKVPMKLLFCVCAGAAHSVFRFFLYSTLAELQHGLPTRPRFKFSCLFVYVGYRKYSRSTARTGNWLRMSRWS